MSDFNRRVRLSWCFAYRIAFVFTLAGCAAWRGTDPHIQNQFVEYYDRLAREVAEPDPTIRSSVLPPSMGTGRELKAPNLENQWILSLAEAIRIGVENSTIIRQNAQFMTPNNPILQSPDGVPSAYDPAIQDAGVLFGSRGVDAALSDFDPRWQTSVKYGNDQNFQNTTLAAPPDNILATEGIQYQTRLEQQLLSGGIFGVNNNWNYQQTNQPNMFFNSSSTGVLGLDFRQPLWAGSGREFTSIAGPLTQRARGFSYINQGIVIAHMNKRLSEIDLQENLQNLVREIGDLYWDLYQNYRDYESEKETSKTAEATLDRARERREIDPKIEELQAEDAFFESKTREELALSNLFLTEGRLRRLLGLSLDDSRLISPSDIPRTDLISMNRSTALYEALVNRTELTRQKLNLQSLELQLVAARKLVAPKLDFVAGYGLNGFGQNFYSNQSLSVNDNLKNYNFLEPQSLLVGPNSAVSSLMGAGQKSWDVGFEYSIPLWLRQEKAQVRQMELKVAKGRAALAAQEDEIAHELNSVLMTIKRSHSMLTITRRRMKAAKERVDTARVDYIEGLKSNDPLLRALTSETQAKSAHYRSVTEYNKALRDLLYRTGRILPVDGISLLGTDGLPVLPPAELGREYKDVPAAPQPAEGEKDLPEDEPEEKSDPDLPPAPKKTRGVAMRDEEQIDSVSSDSSDSPDWSELTGDEPADDLFETPLVETTIPAEPETEIEDWEESADRVTPVSGTH